MSEECSICVYANEYGAWPSEHKGTHCKDCHRSWTGLNELHCVVCHRQFSNEQACDLHKEGTKCLNPEEIFNRKGEPRLMHSTRERLYPGTVWTVYRDTVAAERLSALRDEES